MLILIRDVHIKCVTDETRRFKTIVQDQDGMGCTAWMKAFPGLIVQTDFLSEVPKQIAISLEVMLKYGLEKGVHEVIELKDIFPPEK